MSVVIKLIELANGQPSPYEGLYVQDYDPHKDLVVTKVITQAKRYSHFAEAMTDWRRDTGKLRPDGKPDRPLTAWTIEVVTVRS